MGVSVGDDIVLKTPSGERQVRVMELVPYFSGMTGTIAMSLDTMQAWFVRPGASDLEITVMPGADVQAVRAAIRKAVSPEAFVYSGEEALDGVSSALDQVIAVVTTIAWIVVVVSAVTLLNTLMLSVLDRRREIGVLRAKGQRGASPSRPPGGGGGCRYRRRRVGLILGAAIQYLISIALTDVLSIDVAWQRLRR